MSLEGRQVSFELLSIEDNQQVQFTPRIEMDRVQAIDQLLEGLWGFEKENPIFLKDKQIISSCKSNEPALIKLTPLGNPSD